MKNLSAIALVAVLGITLTTGCTQQPVKSTATEPIILKDGIYTKAGEFTVKGSIPEITIKINNHKITEVKFDESIAMKKSDDVEYQKSFKAQKNIDLLNTYTSLQNSLIKAQDVAKIDVVAGATKTAENFKTLAAEALKDAKLDSKYKDGSYTAEGIMDERYWAPTINITIKDGKIATVKYDEVSSRIFKYKSLDTAYISRFRDLKDIELTAVYEVLQNSLIEKQDPSKVDTVAGATSTSSNFVEIAKKAIELAR